jgi:hypothetical protein
MVVCQFSNVKAYAFLRPYRSPCFVLSRPSTLIISHRLPSYYIQQTRNAVGGKKLEATDAYNMEKIYRSYIQEKARFPSKPVQSEVERRASLEQPACGCESPCLKIGAPSYYPQEYGRKASGDYDRPLLYRNRQWCRKVYTAPEPIPEAIRDIPPAFGEPTRDIIRAFIRTEKGREPMFRPIDPIRAQRPISPTTGQPFWPSS